MIRSPWSSTPWSPPTSPTGSTAGSASNGPPRGPLPLRREGAFLLPATSSRKTICARRVNAVL
ncbi:hypothetical protein SEA_MABODAMACA_57 [Microbacterium phage Mabodamaca]|uniref:Uncharacterized protein n=1 Tax=Microbacterium phage Mabodamaca TaxID=3078574 RepID=A0AA96SFW5_9CAUD|nr:hypothetical protein SEA_MABODAMACA_57 [Microbacterium phage Mabodamaca]